MNDKNTDVVGMAEIESVIGKALNNQPLSDYEREVATTALEILESALNVPFDDQE